MARQPHEKEVLEELRVTLDDASKKSIGDSYRNKFDQATTSEMLAGIMQKIHDVANETPETAAEFQSMNATERLLLAIREVYVLGVLEGMEVVAQAIGEKIDELEKEDA